MEEQKLDFTLPEKKTRGNRAVVALTLIIAVLTGLTAFNLYVTLTGRQAVSEAMPAGLSAKQAGELATKLAQRNLYTQAVKVWKEYLSGANLTDAEQAKTLFNIATLLEKEGLYGDAIEYYYRSEFMAKLPELESSIKSGVEGCLEKMGRFSALRYELMERTSLKKDAGPEEKIAAEIGPQKITAADLDALIENSIDDQFVSLSHFMPPEQLNEQKKKTLEQYKKPQARQQFLRNWLAQEVLYRQAIEKGLSDSAEIKRLLDDIGREVLSQRMMDQQLASKIHITETDLKTYYEANKAKFVEDANDQNSPPRQKTFDEARQQVAMSLMSDKRRDIQQQFIEEMMDKYGVIIHTSAMETSRQETNEQQHEKSQN